MMLGHLARLGLVVLFVAGAVVLVSGALIAHVVSKDDNKGGDR